MQTQPNPQGQPALDPQKQNMLQRLILAAGKLIYASPQTAQQLVAMVKQGQDPKQGIVQATMAILDHLKTQLKGIDPATAYSIAPPLSMMIAELAVAAGVMKEDPKLAAELRPMLMQAIQQRMGQGAAPTAAQPGTPQAAPQGQPQAQGIVQGQMQPQGA